MLDEDTCISLYVLMFCFNKIFFLGISYSYIYVGMNLLKHGITVTEFLCGCVNLLTRWIMERRERVIYAFHLGLSSYVILKHLYCKCINKQISSNSVGQEVWWSFSSNLSPLRKIMGKLLWSSTVSLLGTVLGTVELNFVELAKEML